jgi:hypothetical protein
VVIEKHFQNSDNDVIKMGVTKFYEIHQNTDIWAKMNVSSN